MWGIFVLPISNREKVRGTIWHTYKFEKCVRTNVLKSHCGVFWHFWAYHILQRLVTQGNGDLWKTPLASFSHAILKLFTQFFRVACSHMFQQQKKKSYILGDRFGMSIRRQDMTSKMCCRSQTVMFTAWWQKKQQISYDDGPHLYQCDISTDPASKMILFLQTSDVLFISFTVWLSSLTPVTWYKHHLSCPPALTLADWLNAKTLQGGLHGKS